MSEAVGARPGVMYTQAPDDWQILQQDASGHATLELRGTWTHESADVRVQVAVLEQDTGAAVSRGTDWQDALVAADGTWTASLRVPAGGLYRLSSRLIEPNQQNLEWGRRGDMRHFIGVGDLWVIAGQSNSAGYGRAPIFDPPSLGVHLLRNNMRWDLATHPMNDSTDTAHPANTEGGNPGHSPYLTFAKKLQGRLGYPIGLVQTSLGGSPLEEWNPVEKPDACLFAIMRQCLSAVGSVTGILWYQGESDTGPDRCDTYRDRFIDAVGAWRELADDPDLPVLTVQLNRVTGQPPEAAGHRGWSVVREAQRQVARLDRRVLVVPTTDLPLDDGIHTSSAGNMLLGERLADAALGRVYQQDVPAGAPDLDGIEWRGDVLRLRFTGIVGRLDWIDTSSTPFTVSDSTGDIAVTKLAFHSRNYVDLTLARAPEGRLSVTAGFGADPEKLPLDMARMWPILAFHDQTEY